MSFEELRRENYFSFFLCFALRSLALCVLSEVASWFTSKTNLPLQGNITLSSLTININPWTKALYERSQEVSSSKNVKTWTLRATHHELPHHQQLNNLTPLYTLGRSIIEGDAKWDGDLRFTGGFHYTKGYWEQTEDVLSRCRDKLRLIKVYDVVYALLSTYDCNSDIVKTSCEVWCSLTDTLLTSAEELSISLRDLHDLTGFPMTDCFYDEVVSSVLELTGIDEKRDLFLVPASLYFTFTIFFKALIIIDAPTYPSTNRELKKEAYLAVYLVCCLCAFALPGKDVNFIRPSAFKMIPMMFDIMGEPLHVFFGKVVVYDEVRSLSFEQLSRCLLDQQIKEAKDCLQGAQAKAIEETFKGQKQLNHEAQAKVHEVEKDITTLENTTPLNDVIVENLESSNKFANIQGRLEEFKSFCLRFV
ncbi:hypothetical protein Sango_1590000 [Sesamum angolense]|uniref:Uncharacterized protein n=1 Tax=Sesamum angolense TaxID=2727404 RepID=A0AAE2BTT8_9LAMI|nr:hypothetical protein Sango_1590000 [Sesamum angolense]